MTTRTEIVQTHGFNVYVERHGTDANRPTVLLVNGALSTTTSFRQTTRYLSEHFNVVLYDLPYAGQSRKHNGQLGLLTKDDEVNILCTLLDRYQAKHLMSMSWGGVAALLALSRRPASVRSAAIGSFSPTMNSAMLTYVLGAKAHLEAKNYVAGSELLNNTVGKYLPRLLKLYNRHFLSTLEVSEYAQAFFHIEQIVGLDVQRYVDRLRQIDVPVAFVNGELDEYTSPADVRSLRQCVARSSFVSIPGAGHFLELENKVAAARVRDEVFAFLGVARPTAAASVVSAFGMSLSDAC